MSDFKFNVGDRVRVKAEWCYICDRYGVAPSGTIDRRWTSGTRNAYYFVQRSGAGVWEDQIEFEAGPW